MTIRTFYHSADLDGHCSGAIVKYKYPEAVMYPINYGQEFPWDEIQSDDTVFVVDFCLQPAHEMYRLMMKTNVIWIDHHKSAIESMMIYSNVQPGLRDISKAACELTWEYLFNQPAPLAVKLLSLYDSWTYQGHELEQIVLPFQMRLRMENLDPKNWDECKGLWTEFFENEFNIGLSALIADGRLLLRYDEEQKKRYVRTFAFETELVPFCDICNRKTAGNYDPNFCEHWPHYKAIAVNLGHTNSKVFDSVWKRECPACRSTGQIKSYIDDHGVLVEGGTCYNCNGTGYIEPYDLMITFCRGKKKQWNVSLYSTKPEIDCGAICKTYNGGGHKGAAGFVCTTLPFEY